MEKCTQCGSTNLYGGWRKEDETGITIDIAGEKWECLDCGYEGLDYSSILPIATVRPGFVAPDEITVFVESADFITKKQGG